MWTGIQVSKKEIHAVSVMIEYLETDAIRNTKDTRLFLYQQRRHRLTERNHQHVQVAEEKVLLDKDAELLAYMSLMESARTLHVFVGTLPCVSVTSLHQDAKMSKNADSDTLEEVEEKQCKGSVALLTESAHMGCVSQDSHPSKLFYGRVKIGITSHRPIFQKHVAPHQNSGKIVSIARRYSKV